MYLLDTCVVSELAKSRPSTMVATWYESQPTTSLFLSAITVGELHRGVVVIEAAARRNDMRSWLMVDVVQEFSDNILPVDTEVALRWGMMMHETLRAGRPVPYLDSLIAATALRHRLAVVTRNEDDFKACGAKVLNPWK